MQVRAMQIIDELEVNKRGPYGGGMGYVAYNGNMDIALALRTMVIPNPPAPADDTSISNSRDRNERKKWTVHLQVVSNTVVWILPSLVNHTYARQLCVIQVNMEQVDVVICSAGPVANVLHAMTSGIVSAGWGRTGS